MFIFGLSAWIRLIGEAIMAHSFISSGIECEARVCHGFIALDVWIRSSC